MAYKIFISHSGIDKWVARQIELNIKSLGADTFMDATNVDVGDRFEEKLSVEIKDSKELLVLFTPWSLDRPYVWLEIGAAWILNLRIIVVLHGITNEELIKNPKIPAMIKGNDIITINDLDEYFSQLQKRVNL